MISRMHGNHGRWHAVSCGLATLVLFAATGDVRAQQSAPSVARPVSKPIINALGLNLAYRSIDGSGNNSAHPSWGAANTELLRDTPPGYEDGVSSMAGQSRPGAREISNGVVDQSAIGTTTNSVNASDWVWQWGQFIDHDLDLTPGATPDEPANIAIPLGDPSFDPLSTGTQVMSFSRSVYSNPASQPWREQANIITAYIDGSNVYGSDPVRAAYLRTPNGGFLKTSAGNLMPFNNADFPNAMAGSQFFLAGDVRSNEQNGLTAVHTLFVREHNRLVTLLSPLQVTDEEKYQIARIIVSGEIEAITYNEFLPVLLGPDALPPYTGYDENVNAGIENSFSTGVYRVGHTMLSPTLLRLDKFLQPIANGNLPLKSAFFNPQEIIDNGIEPLLRGLARQRAQEVDVFVVEDVRNFLFGPPGSGGMDLASLNIQRGRDHALGSYNDTRLAHGLAARTSFAEISSNPEIVARLSNTYSSVDDIDLWVGALAEDHVNGGMVGELVFTVLREQFTALRDGDRFFYKLAMPSLLVSYVDSLKLSAVIRLNTPIRSEVQSNVFIVP